LILQTFAASACDNTTGNFCTGLPVAGASSGNLHSLLQVVFGVFAVLAVLMVTISALNFINAQGDPNKVTNARNTIIYALVGLVLSLSAEVIVTFVLGKF
jgi:hypothetical protein